MVQTSVLKQSSKERMNKLNALKIFQMEGIQME